MKTTSRRKDNACNAMVYKEATRKERVMCEAGGAVAVLRYEDRCASAATRDSWSSLAANARGEGGKHWKP